jgi:hypothetical protein
MITTTSPVDQLEITHSSNRASLLICAFIEVLTVTVAAGRFLSCPLLVAGVIEDVADDVDECLGLRRDHRGHGHEQSHHLHRRLVTYDEILTLSGVLILSQGYDSSLVSMK